jgi:hypothetical protein
MSLLLKLAWTFVEVGEDAGLKLVGNDGTIMTHAEWEYAKAQVDAFYKATKPEVIEAHNQKVQERLQREWEEWKHPPKKEPEQRPGYIYLAHDTATNAYKIGYSQDPVKRVKGLNVSTPNLSIELIHHFPADEMAHAEAKLHKAFSEQRIGGEWFTLDQNQIDWIKSTTEYRNGEFWGKA